MASLEDDDYNGDIFSFPIWQETTSVYFQLACRLPYLRQIESLIMACSLIGFLLSDGPGPISTVYQLLVGQPELHSLEQALKVASQLKERGDE